MGTQAIIRRPQDAVLLPDNATYENRFEIRSETSDAVYIVAQHKTGRWWACSCFGWIRHKKCKHLSTLGIPGHHAKYEARLAQ